MVPSICKPGSPFSNLEISKMSDINDELWKIPDADIWELFTGRREPAYSVVNNLPQLNTPISRGEFEVIRDTVSNAPLHGNSDHLLYLVWFRECKFGMAPLHSDNLVAFFTSAYALTYEAHVSAETVWHFFNSLVDSGYIENKDVKLKSGWVKSYPVSIFGKKEAEKWFNDLVLKTEQFDDAPYLPENRQEDAIVQTPTLVAEAKSFVAPSFSIAASGKGNPKSGMTAAEEACQESIEWADDPAEVNVNNPNDINTPIVKAIEKQTKEIQKQTAILENMGESTGRNTAKWLEKAKLPTVSKELREEILSDMGFEPTEVVEKLYDNLNKSERRTKAQSVSKRKSIRKKKVQ
jgi:hypothetical protein